MKVIICVIAKNEDKYIKDFCNYHFNCGFDEIHIFDNGTKIPIEDKRIIIHPFENIDCKTPQMLAYKKMLNNTTCDWDWCAFIDVDEFITLKTYTNIHDYIKSIQIDTDCISMKEFVYGDDNKIFPDDISSPVYERLTKLSLNPISPYFKYIVKRATGLYMINPHIIFHKNNDISLKFYEAKDKCYIRHYKTKTLSEFCEQKLNTPRANNQNECRKLSYYFKENEKTKEKLEYLKSKGIIKYDTLD